MTGSLDRCPVNRSRSANQLEEEEEQLRRVHVDAHGPAVNRWSPGQLLSASGPRLHRCAPIRHPSTHPR